MSTMGLPVMPQTQGRGCRTVKSYSSTPLLKVYSFNGHGSLMIGICRFDNFSMYDLVLKQIPNVSWITIGWSRKTKLKQRG